MPWVEPPCQVWQERKADQAAETCQEWGLHLQRTLRTPPVWPFPPAAQQFFWKGWPPGSVESGEPHQFQLRNPEDTCIKKETFGLYVPDAG